MNFGNNGHHHHGLITQNEIKYSKTAETLGIAILVTTPLHFLFVSSETEKYSRSSFILAFCFLSVS